MEETDSILDLDIPFEEEQSENYNSYKYCICKRAYNCNDIMIPCSVCSESYHIECVGMSIDEYQHQIGYGNDDWKCKQKPGCQ